MNELLGWPFPDLPPLRYGEVEGITWAIALGGTEIEPIINGYARIPWEGHPWSGIDNYNDIPVQVHGGLTYGPHKEIRIGESALAFADAAKDLEIDMKIDLPPVPPSLEEAVVPAVRFRDTGGWVGFDTCHAWDVWSDEALAEVGVERVPLPGHEQLSELLKRPIYGTYQIDWTMERVIAEAQHLAHQIALAGRNNPVQLTKSERRRT